MNELNNTIQEFSKQNINIRDEKIKRNNIKLENNFNNSVNEFINDIANKKKNYKIISNSKTGYIYKKSPNLFHGWQKRYLIVENNELKYYMDNTSDLLKPRGTINFDFISISIIKEPYDPVFNIKIKNTNKIFYFSCDSISDRDDWLKVIKNNVKNAKGNIEDLKFVEKIPKFWKFSLMSYIDLVNNCESGDLLLFNTKNFGAKIQRTFTGSNFDHVGIILKMKGFDFLIFESMGNVGVSTVRWSHFLSKNWQNLYEHISYRKLMIERGESFYKKLHDFIDNNHGKKYELNFQKLMKVESEYEIDETKHEKESYFCSELVSTFFKNLGIIDCNRSVSNYWPGDFSDENEIKFKYGIKLGRQYKLIF